MADAIRVSSGASPEFCNGIEWTLIDTIGHAFTIYESWTQGLMLCSMLEELHGRTSDTLELQELQTP